MNKIRNQHLKAFQAKNKDVWHLQRLTLAVLQQKEINKKKK